MYVLHKIHISIMGEKIYMKNKKSYFFIGICYLIASVAFGISMIVSDKSVTKNIWGIVVKITLVVTLLVGSVVNFIMWKKENKES